MDDLRNVERDDIPFEWDIVPLGKVAKLQGGYAFKSKDYKPQGIPIIRISNVDNGYINVLKNCVFWSPNYLEELKDYELQEGDILISMTGDIGKVARVVATDLPALLNQRVGRFKDINKQVLLPEYLYFYIQSELFRSSLISNAFGAVQSNISGKKIETVSVLLPPLDEQRNIAFVLNTHQREIVVQNNLINSLREVKRSLLYRLFSNGPAASQSAAKETEIGRIPNHWDVIELGSACEFLQYGTSKRCNRDPSGVPVLRIPNVVTGEVDITDLKYIKLSEKEINKLRLEADDLLFVRTNGKQDRTGRCSLFKQELSEALFASYLIRARLRVSTLLPEFLRYYTMTPQGQKYLSGRASMAADGKYNINFQTIRSALVPLLPVKEQQQIVEILTVCDKKIAVEEQRKLALQELFKSMLHQLMTGQIRLKDVGFKYEPSQRKT